MTDLKPNRHRCLSRTDARFGQCSSATARPPLVFILPRKTALGRYRAVQEMVHQRGIEVSHGTLRECGIKFNPLFMDDLRHWLRKAVNKYSFVLDILLLRHRDTEAAKAFPTRLSREYDVPEVVHTDQLRSYGVAGRGTPSLVSVQHQ